jgi:hypothetical protein
VAGAKVHCLTASTAFAFDRVDGVDPYLRERRKPLHGSPKVLESPPKRLRVDF